MLISTNLYDLTKSSRVQQLYENSKNYSLQHVVFEMDGAKNSGKRGKEHIWVDPEEGQYIECVVCANKANGFHYGADTCGACKVGTRSSVFLGKP